MSRQIAGGSDWDHLWEVFHAVRDADPSARREVLERLCRGDRSLESEIEQLLEADHITDSPLDRVPLLVSAAGEAPPVPHIAQGTLLCGRFEIVRRIGQGGMGSVYEATDRSLGGRVALKTLLPTHAGNVHARRRFYREIDLARQVTHPNVCRLFDLFEHSAPDGEIAFVTMELLRGETLADRIDRGPLSTDEALEIARQIAAGLDAAHACGIVHRDLKPGNILLTRSDDGALRVVVTDFGLALRPADTVPLGSPVTRTGQLFGTPNYMAPEQLLQQEITPATDLYAFGIVLYEMITGSIPFHSDSPLNAAMKRLDGSRPSLRQVLPTIDKAWERTVQRCLERDPRERFRSASEVIASLTGGKVGARPRRRRAILWSAAAVVPLALLIALAVDRLPSRSGSAKGKSAMSVTRVTHSGNAVAAALSADGRFVAYVLEEAGRHSLWVKQVATRSTVQIAPSTRLHYRTLAISPDGNYVYAMANERGQPMLGFYRVPILGGEPRRLLSNRGTAEFTISPDGKQIAVRTTPNDGWIELLTLSIEDGRERVVVRRPTTHTLYLPAWSPDGSKIAFGTTLLDPVVERKIEEVEIGSGRTRTIRRIDWPYIASIAWMPDGEHLLVAAYDHEQPPQVWLVPTDGGEWSKVTSDVSAYYSATPAADGVSFAALRGEGTARVSIFQIGDEGIAEPRRSGLGEYFVLAGARVSSAIPNFFFRGGVSWSGERQIVFTGASDGKRTLLAVDRDAGDPRPILEQQAAWSPRVSADGRVVVFISDAAHGHQIWASALDGSNPRQLTHAGYVHSLALGGNDDIYYAISTDENRGIWHLPVAGGTPRRVSEFVANFAISPDGRSLLRIGRSGGFELHPLDGGSPRTFEGPRYSRTTMMRFDPGGRSFSYVDWKDGVANIWRQNLDGGEPRQVTHLSRGEIYAFDWSPSGMFLALAHGEPQTDVVFVRNFR